MCSDRTQKYGELEAEMMINIVNWGNFNLGAVMQPNAQNAFTAKAQRSAKDRKV